MSSIWTQKNLLLLLLALIVTKFLLIPLIEWQSTQREQLERKFRQQDKITQTIESADLYRDELIILNAKLQDASQYFYADSDRTKLEVQKDIEAIFLENDLTIKGYTWVIDTDSAVRALRVSVRFSGSIDSMIKTFWKLGRMPRLIRVIDWEQRTNQSSDKDLGLTNGRVTLEAYAVSLMQDNPNFAPLLSMPMSPQSGAKID
jgi:hypothetical protein